MTGEQAVAWMQKNGRPGYANEINALEASINEHIGDAGRYWQQCEETQRIIRSIRAEIAEVEQSALDRYEDWASDPLP